MRIRIEIPLGAHQRVSVEGDVQDAYDALIRAADLSSSLPHECGCCGGGNLHMDAYRGGQYGPSVSVRCQDCKAFARLKKRKQESGGGFYRADWDKPQMTDDTQATAGGDDDQIAF